MTVSDTSSLPSKGFVIVPQAEPSGWDCYMFGNKPGGRGMVYRPAEGQVPNRFVRFMMRICFDCTWIYNEPTY